MVLRRRLGPREIMHMKLISTVTSLIRCVTVAMLFDVISLTNFQNPLVQYGVAPVQDEEFYCLLLL
jgi:hypothetical protein